MTDRKRPSRKNREIAWRAHKVLWRVSGGRVGTRATGMPVLELITTGRKSGVSRSVLLPYLTEGDSYVVVASNAGDQRHPAWWLNLQDHPEVRVEVAGGGHPVNGRAAQGEERSRLWTRWQEIDQNLDEYAALRSTETAVVILEPGARVG